MEDSIFQKLAKIDVTKKIVQKDKLDYLPWADAWAELKKVYPDANYNVKKFGENQYPYIYDGGMGYMVFTEVTIGELTHEMFLPVMNGANKAMKKEAYTYKTKYDDKSVAPATMFDVNKTIMRCLVKNIAMFGLGLNLYTKDDIYFDDEPEPENKTGIPAIDKATDKDSLKATAPSTSEQKNEIIKLAKLKGFNLNEICSSYKCSSLPKMKFEDAKLAIAKLRLKKDVS